ncbi:TetR/AcrR family transcriptional regulator [Streptomyces sp. NBC_01280]|uniref:TetR/AcrR family transcriptional regulator n=1 Tax=Streptomyces sp. NBC_01280 TaxID=2903810 RepID=UPI002E344A85|nr:helix-turn-helix domain-containing protein [Streptomyces sp. NBC_01280]
MPAQPSHKPLLPTKDQPGERGPAGLRADARRNRTSILEAARAAFASHGIDVPLTTVARRASVGAATLYRHFPTRAALVTAAFAEQLAVCANALDTALKDPDPLRGLHTLLEKVCTMQVTDRGFAAAFMDRFPDALDYDQESTRAEESLARLIQRAKEAGELRDDIDPTDITILLLANSGLSGQPPAIALAASRRLLAHFLRSAQNQPTDPLPPSPPLRLLRIHQTADRA